MYHALINMSGHSECGLQSEFDNKNMSNEGGNIRMNYETTNATFQIMMT